MTPPKTAQLKKVNVTIKKTSKKAAKPAAKKTVKTTTPAVKPSGKPGMPAGRPGGSFGTPPAFPSDGESQPGGETRPRRRRSFGDNQNGFQPSSGGYDKGGNDGNTQIQMSFDKADIQSVIKFLSMITKTPIIVDPDIKGNITIISSKGMTPQEAYEIIGAALLVRGYTMVGGIGSKSIRVVPIKKAATDVTGIGTGKEIKEGISDYDIISQIVPLEFTSSDNLRDQLKSLVSSDQGSLVSVSSTNTLIITDIAGNVRRLMQIIKGLDTDTTGVIAVEVYKCQYASADNLVTNLNSLFQVKSTTGKQPAQQGGRGNPGMPPQPGMDAGAPTATDTNGLAYLKGQLTFTADARTNRLIISGTRDRIDVVMKVVQQLDVDTEAEVKVKFFQLAYADAQTAADQLNSMFEQPQGSTTNQNRPFFFGGGNTTQPTDYAGLKRNVVVADIRTNSVIVTATEQNMKSFENMIKELDAPKVLSEVTNVYPLKYAKASELTTTLTNLFRGSTASTNGRGGIAAIFGLGNTTQNNGPLAQLKNITVVAEPKTNSLLVTGPPNSASVMDELIKKLDKRTAQVFIEVAIVDVTLNKDTQFGVEWQWHSNDTNKAGTPLQSASTNLGVSTQTTGLKYSVLSGNLQALLRALQTQSNVKVLSTPTITTSDNVQATISIGEDQPFVSETSETSGGSIRNTVDFKNVSISLKVTPHVNGSSDVIGLEVQQTINEILGTEPTLNAPIIANRQALTTVSVNDGQTIVIGGIIKENSNRATKAIPLLSSLPLIGELFKSTDNVKTKSELMVFITPRILKTDQDIADLTNAARGQLSIQPQTGIAANDKPIKTP